LRGGVFLERNVDGTRKHGPGFNNFHPPLFIFLCGQENEPKETARAPGPFGLPCASRRRRALWNSLRSDSHRAFFAGGCDARPGTMGHQTPNRDKRLKYSGCPISAPYLKAFVIWFLSHLYKNSSYDEFLFG
jgi:hypothetical protein